MSLPFSLSLSCYAQEGLLYVQTQLLEYHKADILIEAFTDALSIRLSSFCLRDTVYLSGTLTIQNFGDIW